MTFIILIILTCAYAKAATPITGIEGQVTKLQCGTAYDGFTCQWFHNGNKIEPDNSKYIFKTIIMEDYCKLLITDTNLLTDTGMWKCEIKYNDTIHFYSKEWMLNVENFKDHRVIVYNGSNKEIVEGQKLVLICVVEDMINTKIFWNNATKANGNKIEFKNISRYDSGNYTCSAVKNSGYNNIISIFIDVKYPPEIKMVKTIPRLYTLLQTSTIFICIADGNPLPSYSWKKYKSHSDNWDIIANKSQFYIKNTSYSSEVLYTCEVSNIINGMNNTKISKPVHVNIKGAPIINYDKSSTTNISVIVGESNKITVSFCSNPRLLQSYWIINYNLVLESDCKIFRFSALPLETVSGTTNCYTAVLIIKPVFQRDGTIIFRVRNAYGAKHYITKLNATGIVRDIGEWEQNKITDYKTAEEMKGYPYDIVKRSHLKTIYYFRTIGIEDDSIKILRYITMGITVISVGIFVYALWLD